MGDELGDEWIADAAAAATAAAAAVAAWVRNPVFVAEERKKGTHSREQEVEREGAGREGTTDAGGRGRSIIGETIYTRRVQLQSGRTFPRKLRG